jgi:muconolactone delta-isomerase
MDFLVTLTTHVPDGTPQATVEDMYAREAASSRELGAEGHPVRLWRLPPAGDEPRALGRWRAATTPEPRAILESLPLYPWMSRETTELAPHPHDPALVGTVA